MILFEPSLLITGTDVDIDPVRLGVLNGPPSDLIPATATNTYFPTTAVYASVITTTPPSSTATTFSAPTPTATTPTPTATTSTRRSDRGLVAPIPKLPVGNNGVTYHLLVVDDSAMSRKMMMKTLKVRPHHTTTHHTGHDHHTPFSTIYFMLLLSSSPSTSVAEHNLLNSFHPSSPFHFPIILTLSLSTVLVCIHTLVSTACQYH